MVVEKKKKMMKMLMKGGRHSLDVLSLLGHTDKYPFSVEFLGSIPMTCLLDPKPGDGAKGIDT